MASSTNDVPIATSRAGGKFLVNYGTGFVSVSQGKYRSARAELSGGMTRSERVIAIDMLKHALVQNGAKLNDRQLGLLAGGLLDARTARGGGRVDMLPPRLGKIVSLAGDSVWQAARMLYI